MFEVTTVCNLKTPDFDLWPDLDLTRDLNFEFSKVVWKRLVEIFRMPPRPSLYVHPFSRKQGGVGSDPPPPAVVGTETAQAVAG